MQPHQPSDADNNEQFLKPIDLNDEPPIAPDDTNPSKSQQMRAVQIDEPPVTLDDTNPSKSQLMQAVQVDEPPISIDDTSPSLMRRDVGNLRRPDAMPVWRRAVGVLALLGAMGLTLLAVILILLPPAESDAPTLAPTDNPQAVAQVPAETAEPTAVPLIPTSTRAGASSPARRTGAPAAQPTINAAQAQSILQLPLVQQAVDSVRVVRNPYAPFTIIPDRPRGEVIQYTVENGDTINSIATQFGVAAESVVWANPRDIAQVLPVGRTINIPPVNGVYISQHVGSRTLTDYATEYEVENAFVIIDSEYNPQLRGLDPDSVPASGTPIMIPGGKAEPFDPFAGNITVEAAGSGSADPNGGGFVTFDGGGGSCGRVAVPPGDGQWSYPINNYSWMRGYSGYHTGVDLASSVGTPVFAAQNGRVVFAGWNSYGYGYAVVIAQGPYMSLYAHMSSVNVRCGQDVGAGQVVGAVGNTGNSSGPHLHFEIRYNNIPQDPTLTLPF